MFWEGITDVPSSLRDRNRMCSSSLEQDRNSTLASMWPQTRGAEQVLTAVKTWMTLRVTTAA